MNKFSYSIILLFFCTSVQSGFTQHIRATLVDPLTKVFPETVIPIESFNRMDVARGEVASAQLVLRSDHNVDRLDVSINSNDIGLEAQVGRIDYVFADRQYNEPAHDRISSISGFYPDPIIDDQPVTLEGGVTQSLYITVAIPDTFPAGTFPINLTIKTADTVILKRMDLVVYDVLLEEQELFVTNWMYFSPGRLSPLNNNDKVVLFSDTYWKLVQLFADKMAQYKQNVLLISPLDMATYRKDGDQWHIDFSNFDRMIEIFKSKGGANRIEGGHIGKRSGVWNSPFVLHVPKIGASPATFKELPVSDPEAKSFYRQFFTQLVSHLKEKGWWDSYYQHLADEPTEDNKVSYVEIASYVKSLVPDIRIMEACHSKDLAGTIDLWVPQLDYFEKDFDFYQQRLMEDDEVWFYTCLAPKGTFANRFLDLPLIKTRLMHWINFKYGATGYLHWGLNAWEGDPYLTTSRNNLEVGNVFPAGDSWIVYPSYHKLYSSIRLESMRDGINDHTLFTMLKRKNPSLAKKLMDETVFKMDWYDTSIDHFRKVRREMLTALAAK